MKKNRKERVSSFVCFVALLFSCFIAFGCSGGSGSNPAFADNPLDGGGSGNNNNVTPPPSLFDVKPPTIGIVTATASDTQILLSWQDTSQDENGFEIWKDGVKAGETARNIATWTDTLVLPGANYCYKIIAYNKVYRTASQEKCASVPVPLPPAPKNSQVQAETNGILLTWEDASDNEEAFRIIRDGMTIATVPANATSYKDTAITAGISYCYVVAAFNSGGASPDTQQCVTAPYPNQTPAIKILYPLEGELVYGVTRIQVEWSDPDDTTLKLRIFVNGEDKLNIDVNTSSSSISKKWFEVDFTGLFDGNYQITAEVTDLNGATAQAQVNVRINAVELEKKAAAFIINHISVYGNAAYRLTRWQSPPLNILVNPLLEQAGFDAVTRITNYFSRVFGVAYVVEWGAVEIVPSDCFLISDVNPPLTYANYIVIQPDTIPCGKIADGFSDMYGNYQYNIIGPGVIDIRPGFISDFGASSEIFEHLLAHEISHHIPVWGHRDTEDITNKYTISYRIPPELARAFQKVYFEMQAGDITDPAQYGLVCPSVYDCYVP